MAFDKDTGVIANNAEVQGVRDSWVKPEILSFEPVSAAQTNGGSNPGDGLANAS